MNVLWIRDFAGDLLMAGRPAMSARAQSDVDFAFRLDTCGDPTADMWSFKFVEPDVRRYARRWHRAVALQPRSVKKPKPPFV